MFRLPGMQRAIVGKHAPKFTLESIYEEDFGDVILETYRGKYVVVLFYVRDFTPISRSEMEAFSNKADEFVKLNSQVLGISTDSKFTHLAWTGTIPPSPDKIGPLAFPLLSDHNQSVSKHYGVLQPEGHAQSSTFIIDKDGILRHASFFDPQTGRSVTETLRLLQAIQHVDKNGGDGTLADWSP